MKKLLIVNNNLHIGGVQRALINLLVETHNKYDITLALFWPKGELLSEVPPDVRILPICSAYRFIGMTRHDARGRPPLQLLRFFLAAVCRLIGRDAAVSLMALTQRRLTGYDTTISYLHDAGNHIFYGGCNDFVLRHTEAKQKIAFVHCDYLKCGAATESNRRKYSRFDKIAVCSQGSMEAFLSAAPELKSKTLVAGNFQDYKRIRMLAVSEPVSLPKGRVNILTVARLGKEKGVSRAVQALRDVSERNYHYYIIGDGTERKSIERLISEYGLGDRVTLLGEMPNPYGYMAAADLLLISSLSEAAPMVISEAACLGTPVLSTETSSAAEMIEPKALGWVCENSTEAISNAISKLLSDTAEIKRRKNSIKNTVLDNSAALRQFEKIIG